MSNTTVHMHMKRLWLTSNLTFMSSENSTCFIALRKSPFCSSNFKEILVEDEPTLTTSKSEIHKNKSSCMFGWFWKKSFISSLWPTKTRIILECSMSRCTNWEMYSNRIHHHWWLSQSSNHNLHPWPLCTISVLVSPKFFFDGRTFISNQNFKKLSFKFLWVWN